MFTDSKYPACASVYVNGLMGARLLVNIPRGGGKCLKYNLLEFWTHTCAALFLQINRFLTVGGIRLDIPLSLCRTHTDGRTPVVCRVATSARCISMSFCHRMSNVVYGYDRTLL